jgi:hypothetical protein
MQNIVSCATYKMNVLLVITSVSVSVPPTMPTPPPSLFLKMRHIVLLNLRHNSLSGVARDIWCNNFAYVIRQRYPKSWPRVSI